MTKQTITELTQNIRDLAETNDQLIKELIELLRTANFHYLDDKIKQQQLIERAKEVVE